MDDFNNLIDKYNHIDILRTLYPTIIEYTLYISAYIIFIKTDHMLGHEAE